MGAPGQARDHVGVQAGAVHQVSRGDDAVVGGGEAQRAALARDGADAEAALERQAGGHQVPGQRLGHAAVVYDGRLRRVDSGESTRLLLDLLEPSRVDHGHAGHAVGHAALVQGLEPRQLVL